LFIVLAPFPPVSLIPLIVEFTLAAERKILLVLLPLTVSRLAPGPCISIVPLFAKRISVPLSVIVCGDANNELKIIMSFSAVALAASTASRKEQSASQVPSLVSAVFVTV
jgi:hypothetical protein